jgi:hypothetical protein
MKRKASTRVGQRKTAPPRTIGELRERLARSGNPWSVPPAFADSDPIPQVPRGLGQRRVARVRETFATADAMRAALENDPPGNPVPQAAWIADGWMKPPAPPPAEVPPDSPPTTRTTRKRRVTRSGKGRA